MRRTLSSSTLACGLLAILFAGGCATSRSPRPGVAFERGVASWYGPGFDGRFTASGERYDMRELTAAHPSLPFGTLVEVHNLENGRSVRVRVNDRGPFAKNRIIDLSQGAARALGMIGPGTARVELVAVGRVPVAPRTFAVQIGAFRDAQRAAELAAGLCRDYPDVEVSADEVWHRVQVGAFSTRAQAESLAEELGARGFHAVVVPRLLSAAAPR